MPALAVLSRWRAHADAAVREHVAAARRELEPVVRSLACSVPVELRVESGAVADTLAKAVEPGHNRAPLLVLGKKAPGSKGAAPGTIAYRALTMTKVPVLMHLADKND